MKIGYGPMGPSVQDRIRAAVPGAEYTTIQWWFGGDCPILSNSAHLLRIGRITLAQIGTRSKASQATFDKLLALCTTSMLDSEGMILWRGG
jgi:hypothetical protein